ncbi:MAG: hypothetical protein K2K12_04835 [Clostridia bacterium]|nr:hypothetical protein [Clostridia bacterium]
MEEIAIKSRAFVKLIPIYLGVGIVALLVGAGLLIFKKFEIWVYLIMAMGGFSLLAALTVYLLDKKLPLCYIVREGTKLKFDNGFECRLSEVSGVYCKKSVLYVTVGENVISYHFVSEVEKTCQRLLALVEESKKENPNFEKESTNG